MPKLNDEQRHELLSELEASWIFHADPEKYHMDGTAAGIAFSIGHCLRAGLVVEDRVPDNLVAEIEESATKTAANAIQFLDIASDWSGDVCFLGDQNEGARLAVADYFWLWCLAAALPDSEVIQEALRDVDAVFRADPEFVVMATDLERPERDWVKETIWCIPEGMPLPWVFSGRLHEEARRLLEEADISVENMRRLLKGLPPVQE